MPLPLALTLVSLLAGGPLAACQRDNSDLDARLDKIEKQLDEVLKNQRANPAALAQRAQRPRPRPDATYSVPVAGDPSRGPSSALVTIVEGFDFACPYCEASRSVLEQVLARYPKDVRVVYKNFVVHPQVATTPALAACAADRQGKYAAMNQIIWDKGFKAGRNLSAENMEALASELKLDVNRFKADMAGDQCKQRLRDDQSELAAVGVSGTPAFYVNGRFVQQRSVDGFQ
jgi:protein-disulfide isomerase